MIEIKKNIQIVIGFLFFITACSTKDSVNTLRLAFHVYPATLDPRKANDFASCTLSCLLYEGLMRNTPDGSVEPALAEKIEISSDQTVYTFHLRKALWNDGKPVTAYDFEASWKKGIDPRFPSLCAQLFYPIKHCEAIAKGTRPVSAAGIYVLSEQVLQVQLERPCPYFLSLLAFSSFLPVPSHLAEENLDQRHFIVVNGPFYIEEIKAHVSLNLRKNPFFWNKDHIFLEGIRIQIVTDEMTALHLFEQGELDWLGGALAPLPSDAAYSLKQKKNLHFFPLAATTFCTFNIKRFPLHSKKIRKAFFLAIPREEIIEHVMQMGETCASRCLSPVLMGGKDKHLYPSYNPDQARILFQEALKECQLKDCPPLTLLFRSHPTDKKLAQILQKQWKEVLGIEIRLRETDYKMHKESLQNRTYELSLSNWIAQYNDPSNILERFMDPENPKNYPGWESEDFVRQLEKAKESLSPKSRNEWLEKAEELIAEEMPLAPIYHWANASLCGPRVRHLFSTPTGGVLFERCWIVNESK